MSVPAVQTKRQPPRAAPVRPRGRVPLCEDCGEAEVEAWCECCGQELCSGCWGAGSAALCHGCLGGADTEELTVEVPAGLHLLS